MLDFQRFYLWPAYRLPVACTVQLATYVIAPYAIINAVAVAHVEHALGAVPPDRQLDEPRKGGRKTGVELAGIDSFAGLPQDVGGGISELSSPFGHVVEVAGALGSGVA